MDKYRIMTKTDYKRLNYLCKIHNKINRINIVRYYKQIFLSKIHSTRIPDNFSLKRWSSIQQECPIDRMTFFICFVSSENHIFLKSLYLTNIVC